jgi:hypothetical protein
VWTLLLAGMGGCVPSLTGDSLLAHDVCWLVTGAWVHLLDCLGPWKSSLILHSPSLAFLSVVCGLSKG